jgi:glutathione S-transferase
MHTIHHIPVCPFSQRVEIQLALKAATDRVRFAVVDITRPRSAQLLAKTRGSTALPVLETGDGRIIKESLVILRYLEDTIPSPPVIQQDPYRRAVENMMTSMEGDFTAAGYRYLMNVDPARRESLRDAMLAQYARLENFLDEHSPAGTWLFDEFSWAECVFTPMFMRFWFLEYYEGFDLPPDGRFERVRRWRDACLTHPAAQQVSREEIVKLYYDYALGAGNGALLPGRRVSSFTLEPHWRSRPWPPQDKYGTAASDAALGLTA